MIPIKQSTINWLFTGLPIFLATLPKRIEECIESRVMWYLEWNCNKLIDFGGKYWLRDTAWMHHIFREYIKGNKNLLGGRDWFPWCTLSIYYWSINKDLIQQRERSHCAVLCLYTLFSREREWDWRCSGKQTHHTHTHKKSWKQGSILRNLVFPRDGAQPINFQMVSNRQRNKRKERKLYYTDN